MHQQTTCEPDSLSFFQQAAGVATPALVPARRAWASLAVQPRDPAAPPLPAGHPLPGDGLGRRLRGARPAAAVAAARVQDPLVGGWPAGGCVAWGCFDACVVPALCMGRAAGSSGGKPCSAACTCLSGASATPCGVGGSPTAPRARANTSTSCEVGAGLCPWPACLADRAPCCSLRHTHLAALQYTRRLAPRSVC